MHVRVCEDVLRVLIAECRIIRETNGIKRCSVVVTFMLRTREVLGFEFIPGDRLSGRRHFLGFLSPTK